MKLVFEKKFAKDLKKIQDKQLLKRLNFLIDQLSCANSLKELNENIKRMKSNPSYWRIKIGNYRIGLEKKGEQIILVRILHRKDIYKYFP